MYAIIPVIRNVYGNQLLSSLLSGKFFSIVNIMLKNMAQNDFPLVIIFLSRGSPSLWNKAVGDDNGWVVHSPLALCS